MNPILAIACSKHEKPTTQSEQKCTAGDQLLSQNRNKCPPQTLKKYKKHKKNIQEIGTKIMGKKDPAFREPLPQPPLTSPPFPRFARANAPTEAPGLKSGFRDIAQPTLHSCKATGNH